MIRKIILFSLLLQSSVMASTELEEIHEESLSYDPLEPMNRGVFAINRVFDEIFLEPIATLFDLTVHQKIKDSIYNGLDTVFSPINFINFALQGRSEEAITSFMRFLTNSMFGFGIIDIAKYANAPKKDTDTNETFAKWGIPKGPYLMLPLLGPTTVRGVFGMVGDYFITPWNYVSRKLDTHKIAWKNRLLGTYIIDMIYKRYELRYLFDDLKEEYDPYVTIRNVYLQKIAEMEKFQKNAPLSTEERRGIS